MLLAAGRGKRLAPVTELIPKPLVPVLGIPTIEYQLSNLISQGQSEVAVNTHHLARKISEFVESFLKDRGSKIRINVSEERDALLGGAGGIRHAKKFLGDGHVLTINSDVVCNPNISSLRQAFDHFNEQGNCKILFLLCPGKLNTLGYGEVIQTNGQVLKLGAGRIGAPYFSGVAIYELKLFDEFEDGKSYDLVRDVIEPQIAKKSVFSVESDLFWADTGNPQEWWKTHFSVMKFIESTGYSADVFREIIEKKNIKLSNHQWVSSGLDFERIQKLWSGSGYLGTGFTQLENLSHQDKIVGYGNFNDIERANNQIQYDSFGFGPF